MNPVQEAKTALTTLQIRMEDAKMPIAMQYDMLQAMKLEMCNSIEDILREHLRHVHDIGALPDYEKNEELIDLTEEEEEQMDKVVANVVFTNLVKQ